MGKIKSSLSIKIFLGIAAILLAVSITMYGVLRIFMPKAYQNEITAELSNNAKNLVKQLEVSPIDDWERFLISFCVDNSTGATVLDENNEQVAGFGVSVYTITEGIVEDNENTATTLVIPFINGGKQYTVTANVNVNSAEQVTGIFDKVFPYALIIIFIISVLAAFLYSRFFSLQTANEKLQADIEKEREHDKHRRDFFSAISHELKTPVTILKGELDGMILNVGKFKDRDKYLQEAYQTTESIEKLVREILTLAKLDTLSQKQEDIKLFDLVDDCLRIYEVLTQSKRIQIKNYYKTDLTINADKEQMRTVISNIIGNAVKHSPENSTVTIIISKGILSVENSGVHIKTAELPQIWEPFYRTDKSRSRDTGGSGLGLYIVKTILDNHGFEYRLENTETGIKFTVVLP